MKHHISIRYPIKEESIIQVDEKTGVQLLKDKHWHKGYVLRWTDGLVVKNVTFMNENNARKFYVITIKKKLAELSSN